MIYFDNPFRTLGLLTDVTRVGARTAMQSLRARSRMAAVGGPVDAANDPLCALAAANRSEDAVRDAFNALGAVGSRLEARLFWFTVTDDRDAAALGCMAAGDFPGAVAAWSATEEIGACANLARLYHALAIAADVYGAAGARAVKNPWREAVRHWAGVAAEERFWRELALADAAGGFEPAANGEDIAALRRNFWTLLAPPSVALIDRLVAARDYGAACDHIDSWAAAGAPPADVAALESEGFVPFFSRLDLALDDARIALPLKPGTGVRGSIAARYAAYRKLAAPLLADLLKLTGTTFEPGKRAGRKCADLLEELVTDAVRIDATMLATRLRSEARAVLSGVVAAPIRPAEIGDGRADPRAVALFSALVALALLGLVSRTFFDRRGPASRYVYPTSAHAARDADRRGSLHDSDLDAYVESMDSARREPNSVLAEVERADAELDRQSASVDAFAAQLEKTLAGLDRLDSLERTIDRSDTLNRRPTMERARKAWLVRLDDQWAKVDDRYRNCVRLLEYRNRKVSGNLHEAGLWKLKKRELPQEMAATHERLARTMRRLSNGAGR